VRCRWTASAAAFGWYFFPPLNFSLVFDGTEICWTYEGAADWYPLRVAQYPGFRRLFNQLAPPALRDRAPTFLAQGKMPGTVQIWSGYLACTAPGWALLSRRTVNIPCTQPYDNFEGIFETDAWFGPLFTNIRLTRTNSQIEFSRRYPLFQVQPLRHECYRNPPFAIRDAADFAAADWDRFGETMAPVADRERALGGYAKAVRRRQRACLAAVR
jgi:hypothetical protein